MDEIGSDYRPVSRLAVAALAAGVVSALALLSPLCWVLPLVAIGLSLVALADVNRPGATKAGGLAAVAGLALACGFGAQAVSAVVASRWLVERRALATARSWIDAVRDGRLADALSVCAPGLLPGDGPRGLPDTAPGPVDGPARAAAFAALAAVRAVAACGGRSPQVTAVMPGAQADGDWIVVASLAACGRPEESLRMVVEPQRVRRQGGAVDRWLVTGFAIER